MYAFEVALYAVLPTLMLFFFARYENVKGVPSPLKILGWTYLIGYTLKGLFLAVTIDDPTQHRLGFLGNDNVGLGVQTTFWATVIMLLGYCLAPKVRFVSGIPPLRVSFVSARTMYYGLFGLSAALMLTFFTKMGFWSQLFSLRFQAKKYLTLDNGAETSLGFLTMGGDFLLIFALYFFVFNTGSKKLNVYIVVVAFLFLTYFISSRRNAALLMIILFLMVMGLHHSVQKVGARAKKYLIMIGMVVVLSFASAIRDTGREGASITDLRVMSALSTTLHHSMYGAYFMGPAKTGAIIDQTRSRNLFLYGSSYTAIVFAPIPRVLWKSKPPIRNSYFVSKEVLRVSYETGMPPGGIAELFLNFGWAGIFVGMFVVGIVLRLALVKYQMSPDRRFSRIPYAVFMLCVIMFFLADFAMGALFFIRYYIAIFVCQKYWTWKVRNDAQVA